MKVPDKNLIANKIKKKNLGRTARPFLTSFLAALDTRMPDV